MPQAYFSSSNFENRMGRGSFGNLASAATVAASSFDMTVRDPGFLLANVSQARFDSLRGIVKAKVEIEVGSPLFHYSEPSTCAHAPSAPEQPSNTASNADRPASGLLSGVISGKVERLGPNIDTGERHL